MEQIFSKIEAYLAKRDPTVPSVIPYVFKFIIVKNGQIVTNWTLDLKAFKITKGGNQDADVTLTVDEETLGQLVKLQISIEDAVNSGKLTVKGTMEVAQKLAPFLSQLQ